MFPCSSWTSYFAGWLRRRPAPGEPLTPWLAVGGECCWSRARQGGLRKSSNALSACPISAFLHRLEPCVPLVAPRDTCSLWGSLGPSIEISLAGDGRLGQDIVNMVPVTWGTNCFRGKDTSVRGVQGRCSAISKGNAPLRSSGKRTALLMGECRRLGQENLCSTVREMEVSLVRCCRWVIIWQMTRGK